MNKIYHYFTLKKPEFDFVQVISNANDEVNLGGIVNLKTNLQISKYLTDYDCKCF